MTTLLTKAPGWLAAVCQRFTEATGWTLRYTALEGEPTGQVEAELRALSGCCWLAPIDDGRETTGFLHLELPDDESRDRSYRAVTELGEIVGHLLSRLGDANRRLDRRTRDVSTLVEMGLSVQQSEGLQSSLDRLLTASAQLSGYWTSAFFLINPSADLFQLRAVYQPQATRVPFSRRDFAQLPPDLQAIGSGRLRIDRNGPWGEWLPEEAVTGVCVPVLAHSGPIGTLWCYDRRERKFLDREFHVLQSVAAQIAAVLERAVLLRESATQQRLKRELRTISDRQPHGAQCELPGEWGLDVAVRCVSHDEIGGDLCEVLPAGPHRTMVAVGDAVGHSIPATIVMSTARGAFRTLLLDPTGDLLRTDRLVARMNAALYSVTQAEQFMTFVCGVFDARTRTFTYTNAGHPNPLLIRGESSLPLDSHGMLLGIAPDVPYERSSLPLLPGDILVFFTDGITEAMSRRQQFFRTEGILQAISGRAGDTAAEIADAVWQGMETHLSGAHAADDRTLLVLKLHARQR